MPTLGSPLALTFSVQYGVLTPVLNPLIYSLIKIGLSMVFLTLFVTDLPQVKPLLNCLAVQGLRLCASTAGGAGLIPGQGTFTPSGTSLGRS